MDKDYLIVIAGPTAVGKTALAIEVAKALNTEIISADSRQFFKEMSIGTAKPGLKELCTVRHHFINNLSINQNYSVGDFEKEVLEFLDFFFRRKNQIILTGGSGLYINAVTKGFDSLPEINKQIRETLNLEYLNQGINFLQQELEQCDPEFYNQVDRSNPQRLIRALEVFRSSGIRYSTFRLNSRTKRPFEIIKIGLKTDREHLYKRINDRVDSMIENGLVAEVESLIHFKEKNALQTVGYKEIINYLEGNLTLLEAIELVKRNSRRYAKRQMTWFNADEEMVWFENNQLSEILTYIKDRTSAA